MSGRGCAVQWGNWIYKVLPEAPLESEVGGGVATLEVGEVMVKS